MIPAHNEASGIVSSVEEMRSALAVLERTAGLRWEIVVVDDASTDSTASKVEELEGDGIRLIRNEQNLGYGASLKQGIGEAVYDWILISDADGTYPAAHVEELLEAASPLTMVVGARTGKFVQVPWIRRPAKWLLTRLASYLGGVRILDLNSGFRLFSRNLFQEFVRILPDGFSFTSTITIAALSSGWKVRYLPIDYRKRSGRSKIRPIRDTVGFFTLVLRTVLYFDPLRVFLPIALAVFLAAIAVAFGSMIFLGQFMDVTTVVLLTTAVQLLGMGVLADMINRRLR